MPLSMTTLFVKQVLVGQELLRAPEREGSLVGLSHLHEANADVAALILPNEFGVRFQSGSGAGERKGNLQVPRGFQGSVDAELHSSLAQVDQFGIFGLLSFAFQGNRNFDAGSVVAEPSVDNHVASRG